MAQYLISTCYIRFLAPRYSSKKEKNGKSRFYLFVYRHVGSQGHLGLYPLGTQETLDPVSRLDFVEGSRVPGHHVAVLHHGWAKGARPRIGSVIRHRHFVQVNCRNICVSLLALA